MINVLIVSCVFPPEPVVSAQISYTLSVNLQQQGCRVTVIAPPPSRPAGFDLSNQHTDLHGVNLIYLNSKTSPGSSIAGRFLESYSFGKKAATHIHKHYQQIDIVYVNSWPLISQALIAKACKDRGLPYIIHIQDIYPESLINKLPPIIKQVASALLMPIDRYHLKHAFSVIAISEMMKKHLLNTRPVNASKLLVVYNWQDESLFNNLTVERLPQQKFIFMYLGNIGPVAGVETLIKAFIKANIPNSKLVIGGNGSQKTKCMQLATGHNYINIQFINVAPGETANIQNTADVLLLPVIKGGALSSIPSKLPAYMLSAKPIIATVDEGSDTAVAIQKANCGWVGQPESVDWLADKMVSAYYTDIIELKRLGSNGYNYCMSNFSKKINLDRLISEVTKPKGYAV
ncbi:MAG: glycosyltransferase family 4 protein [Bacteroidota bacterium]